MLRVPVKNIYTHIPTGTHKQIIRNSQLTVNELGLTTELCDAKIELQNWNPIMKHIKHKDQLVMAYLHQHKHMF